MAHKSTITVSGPFFGYYTVGYEPKTPANCGNREKFKWLVDNRSSTAIQVYLDNFKLDGQPVESPITPPVPSSGVVDAKHAAAISVRAKVCAYPEKKTYTYDINLADEFGESLRILHKYCISIDGDKVVVLEAIDPELEMDL